MEEIEVKFLEVDKGAIIKKLESLGAKKVFEGEVDASFYDFPDSRLKKDGSLLRLRTKGENAELTFKKKISKEEAKIMKELEIKLDDPASMKRILDTIGLVKQKSYVKYRSSYKLGDVSFELDTFPGIPTFLEIEAPSIAEIKVHAEKLGLSMADAKPWGGGEVLRHYEERSS